VASLARALWIGGGQWAGKSTIANLLAARYPIVRYSYDYHDARSHAERARRDPERFPAFDAFLAALESDPSTVWVDPTPAAMAEQARAIFAERFEMVLEDIAGVPGEPCVLAEGWGLRPELVAPQLVSAEQAVFLVPTDAFRERQQAELERAQRITAEGVKDARRAQQNRVERDRILGQEVVTKAQERGLPLIYLDGTADAGEIAARVAEQFEPYLPSWLYSS
jgi:hypothetical protein